MADLVSCRKCGKIHPRGVKCIIGGYSNLYKKDTKANSFRSSGEWKTKRNDIKSRSNNICAVCLDKGKINYKNLEIHHIEKIEDSYESRLDDNNLICLCSECHHKADAGEIDKVYLKSLVKKRDSI